MNFQFTLCSREGHIIGGTYTLIARGEVDCNITVDNMKDVMIYPPVSVVFVDSKTCNAWLGAICENAQARMM